MNTRDFIKFRVFRPLLLKIGRWMGRYSMVGDHPVFDNGLFSWTALLEKKELWRPSFSDHGSATAQSPERCRQPSREHTVLYSSLGRTQVLYSWDRVITDRPQPSSFLFFVGLGFGNPGLT